MNMETTQYELKRQNRFMVVFPKSFEIEPWKITQLSRPVYNMELKKWERITIEFIDPIATSTSKSLYKIVEQEIDTISFTIEMLDPTGEVVEKWEISGSIIEVNFDKLNYSLENLLNPTITIQPTSCALIK